jgi:hypothetical protein
MPHRYCRQEFPGQTGQIIGFIFLLWLAFRVVAKCLRAFSRTIAWSLTLAVPVVRTLVGVTKILMPRLV